MCNLQVNDFLVVKPNKFEQSANPNKLIHLCSSSRFVCKDLNMVRILKSNASVNRKEATSYSLLTLEEMMKRSIDTEDESSPLTEPSVSSGM